MEGFPNFAQDNIIEKTEKAKALDFAFEQNSELAQIWSKEQYSEYLDSIFPDTVVKEILYHRASERFEVFDKTKTKKINGNRFYFSPFNTGRYGSHVMQAILNIRNLAMPQNKEFIKQVNIEHPEYTEGKSKFFHLPAQIYLNASRYGYDGVYAFEGSNDDEYSVYESEQIHMLGTKKDIDGFRDFVDVNQNE
jgi:hypothetical protein